MSDEIKLNNEDLLKAVVGFQQVCFCLCQSGLYKYRREIDWHNIMMAEMAPMKLDKIYNK